MAVNTATTYAKMIAEQLDPFDTGIKKTRSGWKDKIYPANFWFMFANYGIVVCVFTIIALIIHSI